MLLRSQLEAELPVHPLKECKSRRPVHCSRYGARRATAHSRVIRRRSHAHEPAPPDPGDGEIVSALQPGHVYDRVVQITLRNATKFLRQLRHGGVLARIKSR